MMKLTKHMIQSETWICLEQILNHRVEVLRGRLEVERDPALIAEHQGGIKEIRLMLQLGKVRERLEPDAALGF